MNYLTEIRLFYEWLGTHPLPPSAIALWHGLMYIANCCGWEQEITIPLGLIQTRTMMTPSSIYRSRRILVECGLVTVSEQGSNRASIYTLNSFEDGSAYRSASRSACQYGRQNERQCDSHNPENEGSACQYGRQSEDIYKHKHVCVSKEKDTEKEKKKSLESWIVTVDSPWRELIRIWFEYKKARNESYKSEMSAKAFLTKLRNLSGDNPQTAQAIIEQSMASNWAGIFELKNIRPAGAPRTPATGQRIGQIIQPSSDSQRQALLDKFNKK